MRICSCVRIIIWGLLLLLAACQMGETAGPMTEATVAKATAAASPLPTPTETAVIATRATALATATAAPTSTATREPATAIPLPVSDCPLEPNQEDRVVLPAGTALRVLFAGEEGVQLWDETTDTVTTLFATDDVRSVAFSDDQAFIAFTRENEAYQVSLWVIDMASGERYELLSSADFLALNLSQTRDQIVDPYRMAWIPGSHHLAFSTRSSGTGDMLAEVFKELRVIDAESGTIELLLSSEEGGTPTYAPDGQTFALVRDGGIALYGQDGNLIAEDIVTYPPLAMTDDFYHPPIYWHPEGAYFLVAVVNASDSMAAFTDPNVTATIWRVDQDGEAAELGTVRGMSLQHDFAPDLAQVAFLRPGPLGPPNQELHIAAVNGDWDVLYREGDGLTFNGWNPAAALRQFLFYDRLGEAGIGRLCHNPVPLLVAEGVDSARRVTWVDSNRYLYTNESGTLYLGSLTGEQQIIGQLDPERTLGARGPLHTVQAIPQLAGDAIASNGEMTVDTATDVEQARAVLERFFIFLNEGRYAEAADLYGGEGYRQLRDWNPKTDPHDHAALFAQGCTINGLHCLPAASVTPLAVDQPHVYRFAVTFVDDQGRPVVVPGVDGGEQETFDYTVVRMANGYFVRELPVYLP